MKDPVGHPIDILLYWLQFVVPRADHDFADRSETVKHTTVKPRLDRTERSLLYCTTTLLNWTESNNYYLFFLTNLISEMKFFMPWWWRLKCVVGYPMGFELIFTNIERNWTDIILVEDHNAPGEYRFS